MSTQHPDNVTIPPFAAGPLMSPDDEIAEAYRAFAVLGCDEQLWDYDGKRTDGFVVEKLLAEQGAFFQDAPLGEAVALTIRVPNPALERSDAKLLLEVLHSLPRHADAARIFYGHERVPVGELIFPMTTSAAEIQRVRRCYERLVVGAEALSLVPGDPPLGSWFGPFQPTTIRVTPLIEDLPSLLTTGTIAGECVRAAAEPYQRVFIARSDPALNYGMISAILLSLVALQQLAAVERELAVPVYPIIGLGGAPFRGGLRPDTVARVLARYPSVQTFTLQSAFKYDHPIEAVIAATATLRSAVRAAPVSIDPERAERLLRRVADRYREEIALLAPMVNQVALQIPQRRSRKLHVGLFGFSRSSDGVSLPRAIPLCASLYSIGLPPELLGLAALDEADWRWLEDAVPGLLDDLRDAAAYLDTGVLRWLPVPVRASVAAALARLDPPEPEPEHVALTAAIGACLRSGRTGSIAELVLRAGGIRRFLG